jgi:hypothetical protein
MAPEAALPERVRPGIRGAGNDAPGRATWSDRLPRAWLFPLLAFAATWLLILATWYGTDRLHGQTHPWTWHFLFKDAGWFEYLAKFGYPARLRMGPRAAGTAFFPLFPLLIRLASRAVGSYVIGGLVVSVLVGAASAAGVWAVAARVRDRWVADRAVMLYCFFPGAMVFGMLYSEPLSVALGAAVLLALLSRRWLLAGVIGAVATAEASMMIIVVAVSGIAALEAIWRRDEWRALIAPALSPLGILAFFGYLGHRYHDYAFWFQVERVDWNQHIDWGARTLGLLFGNNPGLHEGGVMTSIYVIMLYVSLAGLAVMLAARLPLPVTAYGVLVPLTFLLSRASPRPRYVLCAFPLFIGAAAKLPRVLYWPVLALSAAGLVLLTGWWPYHYGLAAP